MLLFFLFLLLCSLVRCMFFFVTDRVHSNIKIHLKFFCLYWYRKSPSKQYLSRYFIWMWWILTIRLDFGVIVSILWYYFLFYLKNKKEYLYKNLYAQYIESDKNVGCLAWNTIIKWCLRFENKKPQWFIFYSCSKNEKNPSK